MRYLIFCLAACALVAGSAVRAQNQPEQAGSAVVAVGQVTDTASDGSVRQLHDGDAVYSGDRLTVGDNSYLDVDYLDGGRMLLRPGTDFQIERYHFDPAAHGLSTSAPAAASVPPAAAPGTPAQTEPENAFFRLFKGGLRALSGLIGHEDHQDYALETPVATIGIRGTAYEVRYCQTGCSDEGGASQNGLYTAVGKGAIGVKNDSGEAVTTAGHFGYLAGRQARFTPLTQLPRALHHMQLPPRYWQRDQRMHRSIQQRRLQRWPNYRETLQRRLGRPAQRGNREFLRPRSAGTAGAFQADRHAPANRPARAMRPANERPGLARHVAPAPKPAHKQNKKKKEKHPPARRHRDGRGRR